MAKHENRNTWERYHRVHYCRPTSQPKATSCRCFISEYQDHKKKRNRPTLAISSFASFAIRQRR